MSTTVGTITILAGLFGLVGIQTFWVVRALDSIDRVLDRIDTRLDRIEGVLIAFGERITRLEEHS
jgi:hypothetical protein